MVWPRPSSSSLHSPPLSLSDTHAHAHIQLSLPTLLTDGRVTFGWRNDDDHGSLSSPWRMDPIHSTLACACKSAWSVCSGWCEHTHGVWRGTCLRRSPISFVFFWQSHCPHHLIISFHLGFVHTVYIHLCVYTHTYVLMYTGFVPPLYHHNRVSVANKNSNEYLKTHSTKIS